jgi:malate permease and related proteins
MHEFLQILGGFIPIFLLMAAGAVVRRANILTEQADRSLLSLVVHIFQPCLILDHVIPSETLRRSGNLLWSPLLGFACMALGIGMAALLARIWGIPSGAKARTFAFTAGIFNYNYIAIPLVGVLYGADTLAVLFVFNLGVEVAFWTVGFAVFEGRSMIREWSRIFTTPVRAVLFGTAINLLTGHVGIRLDPVTLATAAWGWPVKLVMDTIHLAGTCMIPIAMLLIGATMSDFWSRFHSSSGAVIMILAVAVRNLICPILFVLAAWLLPISQDLKETLVVQAAMPAGVMSLLLARHHGGDMPIALQVVFSTSAAAIITLPLWIHFGMQWIGLK